MKRILTLFISIFLILSPMAAFDFGGYLDNASTVSKAGDNDINFDQANSLFLWASTPIGAKMYFKTEGMCKFNYNTSMDMSADPKMIKLDLDLFKFAGEFADSNGTFSFSAGRFNYSDTTGVIFSQACDGVFLQYAGQVASLSLYAGYTGLQNSNIVSILGKDGAILSAENPNGIYDLCAGYLPVSASVSFPSLFLNQTLSVQASGFVDFGPDSYNRMYATLDLTGPVSSIVFYDLTTSFGTGNFENLMNYSNLSVMIFPKSNIRITTGVMYASGNQGSFSSFLGFSSHAAYNAAVDVQTTNCIVPSLGGSVSLVQDKLLLSLTCKGVIAFEQLEGQQGSGFQGDAAVLFNVFPDLQLGLSGTIFKAFEDPSLDKFSATLKVAFTF